MFHFAVFVSELRLLLLFFIDRMNIVAHFVHVTGKFESSCTGRFSEMPKYLEQ